MLMWVELVFKPNYVEGAPDGIVLLLFLDSSYDAVHC